LQRNSSAIELDGQDRIVPEYVTCNLCGADDTRLLYTARDYRFRIDDRLWNLVQCRRCSLGYLNPRPTVSESAKYYPDAYFGHRGRMTRRYELEATYVSGPPGDLLDIGAAGGDFMAVMRGRGWHVSGIEPSTSENPHGLDIRRQRFPEECELDPQSFDVVTAWAVFEHLHDPATAFRRAADLVRAGGHLIVQVPNLRSINARYARLEDIPRHLYFFSPSTLEQYATLAGLRVDAIQHTTDLHGGSGRGVLRRLLVHALGGTDDDFFAFYAMRRRQRFRASPVRAAAWTLTGAIESVLLTDRLVRTLRMSGEIVAVMRRRPDGGSVASAHVAYAAGNQPANRAATDRDDDETASPCAV
jgi:2-polyprenyl-3-methyl-5-hydroxy-6-metoxy-1,4-benzoquinol methylase